MRKISPLKKYHSFFRLRLVNGMQYRAAALGGIATQFAWGFMEIMIFSAFYHSSAPGQFPMEMQALSSYLWMQQAFLMLFAVWFVDTDILELITSGNLAYELCRPLNLYVMWFVRDWAGRLSRTALRCLPVLIVAALLPKPYGMSLPKDLQSFTLFLISMLLASLLVVSCGMLVYIGTIFTLSSGGIRTIFSAGGEILSGKVVPLPFLPAGMQTAFAFLPFASMQNVPLRIYSGDLTGTDATQAILLQLLWLTVLTGAGLLWMRRAVSRAVVQGG